MCMAFGFGIYYNVYPGANFEGFFETLISFGAALVYGLFFFISFLVMRKK